MEGVNVYCDSCGSLNGHTFTLTDSMGDTAFPGHATATVPIMVWKDGYGEITAVAMVNGDTRFDVQIVRR